MLLNLIHQNHFQKQPDDDVNSVLSGVNNIWKTAVYEETAHFLLLTEVLSTKSYLAIINTKYYFEHWYLHP